MAIYFSSTKTSSILNVWTTNDAGQYYTDNTTGSTFLDTTFTPHSQGSKFLIMATINGAGNDDDGCVLQRYASGSWSEPDELRGSTGNNSGFRGSFGDLSCVRGHEDKLTTHFTAVFIDQPNVSGTIGYRVRFAAENNGGCFINRCSGNDGGFNTNSSRSTMVIFELGV